MSNLPFGWLVLCMACLLVNGLELERLCTSWSFEYKDGLKKVHQVNSFYRIEHKVQLKEIGYYGLDTQLNFRDYFGSETGKQLNHLKNDYNSKLINLYSLSYLNSRAFLVDWTKYGLFSNMRDEFRRFQNDQLDPIARAKLEEAIERTSRGMQLAGQLINYKVQFLHPEILSLNDFKKLIGNLKTNPATETMVFASDSIIDTYRKLIFKFDRFDFHPKSLLFFDWSSDGTLVSSIYVPFELKEPNEPENGRSSSLSARRPCRSGEDLPKFFSSKNGRVR